MPQSINPTAPPNQALRSPGRAAPRREEEPKQGGHQQWPPSRRQPKPPPQAQTAAAGPRTAAKPAQPHPPGIRRALRAKWGGKRGEEKGEERRESEGASHIDCRVQKVP